MRLCGPVFACLFIGLLLTAPVPAAAQDRLPAITDFGGAGLMEMPTAFMPPAGMAWFGGSGGPAPGWRHGFAGFEAVPWLETTVRYSDFSGADGGFDLLAADVKLRLVPESARLPQIAIGARGLFGEGVLAGEYLVASKHFRWGEATLGIGWGRFAGRGVLPNPLRTLAGRFGEDRPERRESGANGFSDLFTGEVIDLFGGVSLRTPWRDLRLQLEYSSDDFAFERRLEEDFRARLPINIGLVWRPVDGIQLGAAFEQGNRAMLRLAFGFRPSDIPLAAPPRDPPPIRPRAAAPADAERHDIADALGDAGAAPAAIESADRRLAVWIDADPARPAGLQIGRAARALTAAAPPHIAAFDIALGSSGFDMAEVSLIRGDLERAARFAGSPEEIWRDADLRRAEPPPADAAAGAGLDADGWFELRGEVGAEAPERELLTRWSLLAETELRHRSGLVIGAGARAELADNLVLPDFGERLVIPVRSDRVFFARSAPIRLERGYVGWRWQPATDLFAQVSFGFLEEAYAGLRTELLWRPFGRRFAIGIDSLQGFRRDPVSQWQLFPIAADTAHLNLYWRPPGTGLTTQLSLGRYLAGDVGGEARAWRTFDNGLRLGAWATVTNSGAGDDPLTGGVELVVPLQRLLPWLPRSRARMTMAPLLRDSGQRLDWPDGLYALSDPASYEAVTGSWGRLLE